MPTPIYANSCPISHRTTEPATTHQDPDFNHPPICRPSQPVCAIGSQTAAGTPPPPPPPRPRASARRIGLSSLLSSPARYATVRDADAYRLHSTDIGALRQSQGKQAASMQASLERGTIEQGGDAGKRGGEKFFRHGNISPHFDFVSKSSLTK